MTDDPNILIMDTVMLTNRKVCTVQEEVLCATTLDIVQPDRCTIHSIGKATCSDPGTSAAEAQLSASHVGIRYSKEVITDCSPGAIVADFEETILVAESSSDPECSILTRY